MTSHIFGTTRKIGWLLSWRVSIKGLLSDIKQMKTLCTNTGAEYGRKSRRRHKLYLLIAFYYIDHVIDCNRSETVSLMIQLKLILDRPA